MSSVMPLPDDLTHDDEAEADPEVHAWYAKAKCLDLEAILARTCRRLGAKALEETPLGHLLQAWQSEPPWDPCRPVVSPQQLEGFGRYVVLQLAREFATAMAGDARVPQPREED